MSRLAFATRLVLLSVLLAAASAGSGCPVDGPSISAVSGCARHDSAGAYDCVAGDSITLYGSGFDYLFDDTYPTLVQIETWSLKIYEATNLTRVAAMVATVTLPDLQHHTHENPHDLSVNFGEFECPALGSYTLSYLANTSSSSSSAGGNAPSATSSTAAPTSHMRIPVLVSLSGCASNASASADDTSSCDGSSGASVVTIRGSRFWADGTTWDRYQDSMAVNIDCRGGGSYQAAVDPAQALRDDTMQATLPQIDKADVNQSCSLRISHYNSAYPNTPTTSNALSIRFATYATDEAQAWSALGMSLVNLIIAVTVVGVVILVLFILCTLSCCCGVSLACLNCCCRDRPAAATVVYSPQVAGYATHMQPMVVSPQVGSYAAVHPPAPVVYYNQHPHHGGYVAMQ